jgi:hypothetical protein
LISFLKRRIYNTATAAEWEPGKPCSIYLKCPCGDIFNSHRIEENLIHVPHITQERAHRSAYRLETAADYVGGRFSPLGVSGIGYLLDPR